MPSLSTRPIFDGRTGPRPPSSCGCARTPLRQPGLRRRELYPIVHKRCGKPHRRPGFAFQGVQMTSSPAHVADGLSTPADERHYCRFKRSPKQLDSVPAIRPATVLVADPAALSVRFSVMR